MELLLKRLASLGVQSLDSVLHIGAGSGAEIDCYRSIDIHRLVLIEGDPETAEELRTHPRLPDNAEVLEQVIAAEGGAVEWHRYNLPALNGVLAPAGLRTLYPRLKMLNRERANASAVEDVLKQVGVCSGGSNLLFLDVPGIEAALLASVPDQLLQSFAWIAVRGCQAACHEGGAPIDAVRSGLYERCFSIELVDAETDPNWPVLLLRRDEAQRENQRLRANAEQLSAALDAATAEVSATEAKLAQVSRERDEQMRLLSGQSAAIRELNEERDAQIKRLAELQARADELLLQRDEQGRLATERQLRLAELTQAHEEQASFAQDRQTQIVQLQQQLRVQAEQLAEQSDQLADLRSTASLTVRLHAQREADLKDLQDRYRKVLELKTRQDDLLAKLVQRLTLAADYLRARESGARDPQLIEGLLGEQPHAFAGEER